MKRKNRSSVEKQQESCGIWLDTSALKKRKTQALIAKSTLRLQKRPLPYPVSEKAPLPFTKQTTISTFFRTETAGERKISTNVKSDGNLQGHQPLKGERCQLVASVFPPIPEFRLVQHDVHGTTAQSKAGKSAAEDENLDSTWHPMANAVTEHNTVCSSPPREKWVGWRTSRTLHGPTAQNLKVLRRDPKRPSCSKSCPSDSSDSENRDPRFERRSTATRQKGFNRKLTRMPLETDMALCSSDKGPKNSLLGCTNPLFGQGSEDHRLISPLSDEPAKPLRDKSNRGTSPARRDCFGACFPEESGPQLRASVSLPAAAEIKLNSCYDLLFTEDSEGNRVIKH